MSAVPMDRPRLADMETTLYRCWSEAGDLLYVGITSNLTSRLKQHKYGTDWFPQVARVTATAHPDRMSALVAEAQAIETESPLHNRPPKYSTELPSVEWVEAAAPAAPSTGERDQ